MTKGQKILTGLMIFAFLALVGWVVVSVPDPPPKDEHKDEKQIMSYENNTLTSEKNGKLQWLLKAEKMSVDVATQDANMEGIEVEFYTEDGKTLKMKAPKGVYYNGSKNFGVYDGARVTTSDGAELTSGKLYWLAKEEMLVAEDDVKLKKDDLRASGNKMESKNGFTNFKIRGKAHLEKGVKDEKK